jgi:hypothetical protein
MKSSASSAVIEVEWQRFRQANQAVGLQSLEKGNKHPHTKYRRQIEPDKERNRWGKKKKDSVHMGKDSVIIGEKAVKWRASALTGKNKQMAKCLSCSATR